MALALAIVTACSSDPSVAARDAKDVAGDLAVGWTQVWAAPRGTGGSVHQVAGSSLGFVATVAPVAGRGITDLWYSADGYAWERVHLPGAGSEPDAGAACPTFGGGGVAASDRHLIVVGEMCDTGGDTTQSGVPAAWISNNGVDWQLTGVGTFSDKLCNESGAECAGLADVAVGPAGIVVEAWGPEGLHLLISEDGQQWEELEHPGGESFFCCLVVSSAAGVGLVDGGTMWLQPEGNTWHASDLTGGIDPWIDATLVTDDGILLTGVANSNEWSQPSLWMSSDFVTWERGPDPYWMDQLASWNGGYVGIGYSAPTDDGPALPLLLASVDGVLWEPVPFGLPHGRLFTELASDRGTLAGAEDTVVAAGRDADRWSAAIWTWSDPEGVAEP